MKKQWIRSLLCLSLVLASLMGLALPCLAIEPPDDVKCTPDEELKIWNYLMELTKNPVGAAGIMGNLFYESHLSSTNLETMGKQKPEFPDGMDYTEAVDKGIYKRFTSDGFGYGLAQWTYGGRKQRMLAIAQEQDKSIGDLDVQLALIAEELDRYNMLYRISTSDSLRFVAEYVLENFENPANQGTMEKRRRHKKARYFYDKYFNDLRISGLTEAQKRVASIAIYSDAYGIPAEEGLCQAWASDVVAMAGFEQDHSSSAEASAKSYGLSEDFSKIPVGAAVYGHSSSRYGHVGIYVGNGQVYHNVGGVQVDTLEDWIANYRGFCWGWLGGTDLSKVTDEKLPSTK